MVNVHRKTMLFREVWFNEPWSPQGADVVLFYHWDEPMNPAACKEVHSLEIDLRSAESDIWSGFTASTRNQINRAGREGIRQEIWLQPDSAIVDQFFDFFRMFRAERSLGTGDPLWMHDYARQGALALTRAVDAADECLVWHSYFRNASWVRQLQSVSLFANADDKEKRNKIARANRYLHWADLTAFQKESAEHFDFGGWYAGGTDEKLLRINAFKEEFGGAKTTRFHSVLPVSITGKLFMKAREHLRGSDAFPHVV